MAKERDELIRDLALREASFAPGTLLMISRVLSTDAVRQLMAHPSLSETTRASLKEALKTREVSPQPTPKPRFERFRGDMTSLMDKWVHQFGGIDIPTLQSNQPFEPPTTSITTTTHN